MYSELKDTVFEANRRMPDCGLVVLTWGNASEVDRKRGVVAIKPSGILYEEMTPEDIVVVDMDGKILDGEFKPSSDTPAHLELYRAFPEIGGIVHTHATFSTAFAQACRPIPCMGTTHADYFYGTVPLTRKLTENEVATGYERETGKVIAECFREKGLKPLEMPGVLVAGHGPFSWGKTALEAVENALVLEKVAELAQLTFALNGDNCDGVEKYLLNKHYLRKHGKDAYYGQKNRE